MSTLPESILLHTQSLPEGGVLSPKEFLHLGSRAAVDQALSRLTKEGRLLRVARGTYVSPVSSRFGTRPPTPEKVVHALATQTGEVMTPHGASSANTGTHPASTDSGGLPDLRTYAQIEARTLGSRGKPCPALDAGPRARTGWCRSACTGLDGARTHRRITGYPAAHAATFRMAHVDIGTRSIAIVDGSGYR
jgi:hypothetical protein